MIPEKESKLQKLIEEVYQIKLTEAGVKPSYSELEAINTTFECEKLSLVATQRLSLDQLFDCYNDYRTLFFITDESKFLARAHFYSVQIKKRMKGKGVS